MEQNDYYEEMRIKEELNNKMFESIKFIFNCQNEKILFSLFSKGFCKINANELIKCGFDFTLIVKSNSNIENPFFGKVFYYSENHFVGYDLLLEEIGGVDFTIVKTDNSIERVNQLIIIRDKKIEVQSNEAEASSYLEDMECQNLELNQFYKELARKAKLELIELENKLKFIR